MFNVSKEIFYDFINKNQLKEIQGDYFHSNNYIDNKNNIRAYRETSSWGAETIYQIDDVKYSNFKTLNIINNFLNI
jgi:hypothetical protein